MPRPHLPSDSPPWPWGPWGTLRAEEPFLDPETTSARADLPRAWLGMLLVVLLLGAALIASAALGYRNTASALDTLIRGQGETYLVVMRAREGPRAGPPTSARLELMLEEQAPRGLRFIAFLDPDGTVIAAAGERTPGDRGALRLPEDDDIMRIDGRVRLALRPPQGGPPPGSPRPPPPGDRGPPPQDDRGPPRDDRGPPPGDRGPPPRDDRGPPRDDRGPPPPDGRGPPRGFRPPVIVVEFEPTIADALHASAARSLGVSSVAALTLMVAAAVLYRLAMRAADAERRFQRQRHLATLGEMSAVLAHEIRNPLASLKGHAQLLSEQLPEDGRERRRADRVVQEAQRLEALTNHLLDFARSGEIQRADVAPVALVEEVAEAVAPGRAALRLGGAPALWSLDPLRMRQLLTNLLANALQASPPDEAVDVALAQEGGALVLSVRDRGQGIAAGQEERIFDAFHTTRAQGTGLGLAVARRIVELHGGTIRASNHPEGGALFTACIPWRAREREAAAQPAKEN